MTIDDFGFHSDDHFEFHLFGNGLYNTRCGQTISGVFLSHNLNYVRGVIMVSIVSAGGEVCIAYISVSVNSGDPRHIIGYL